MRRFPLIAFRGATAWEFQIGRLYGGWVHLKGGYWSGWKFWRRPYLRWDDSDDDQT